jgi:hypothetical protein
VLDKITLDIRQFYFSAPLLNRSEHGLTRSAGVSYNKLLTRLLFRLVGWGSCWGGLKGGQPPWGRLEDGGVVGVDRVVSIEHFRQLGIEHLEKVGITREIGR